MKKLFFIVFVLGSACAAAQETKENADFKLAVSLYNDKLYDLALEQFRQFISAYPNTPQGSEARFYLGLTQSKLGKHEDARFTFQNFALSYPEHPKAAEAWWNVAEAYLELHNPREAALAFERVKTFHPKSKIAPAALLKAGQYFKEAADFENSKKVLRALTQEYGSADVVLEARLQLSNFYFDENEFELARSEAQRVAEGTKNQAQAAEALGLVARSLSRLGKLDEARRTLNDLVAKHRGSPASYEAMVSLGILQREAGDIDEAKKTWGQVVDRTAKPSLSAKEAAYMELGNASTLEGNYEEGLAFYESALSVKSGRSDEALLKAARTAERIGNFPRAAELYQQGLGDSLMVAQRRSLLAGAIRASEGLKNYNAVVRSVQRWYDDFPKDNNTPSFLLLAANTFANHLDDPRRAISWYEILLNDFAESDLLDDALFGYAKALEELGEYAQALQALESLFKRFPASELLESARDERYLILHFEQKDREGGLKNLALLTGDVIAGKAKGDLAFRLGEIYFNDLKDYQNAEEQYVLALNGELSPETRMTAAFRRAQALERQAWMAARTDRKGQAAAFAVAAYDSALKRYPGSPYADDALLSRSILKIGMAGTVSELNKLGEEVRKAAWAGKGKQEALLALAKAFQSKQHFGEAAAVVGEILRMGPIPSVGSRALFLLARSKFERGERDSGAVVLDTYLGKYPTDEFSAEATLMRARYATEQGATQKALTLYNSFGNQFAYAGSNDLDVLRGDAYYMAGDVSNALLLYQESHDRIVKDLFTVADPPVDLIGKLADCYRRSGKRAEAKRYYAQFLIRDTSSSTRVQVYYLLASMAQEEKNFESAAQYLRKANSLGSASPEQRQRMAMEEVELLFRNDDYKGALARLNDLLPQVQGDSLKQYLQSRVILAYFRLDNLAEADKRSNAFVRSYPKAGEYAAEFEYERGRYHLRKDEADLAIRRFENVRQRYGSASIVPENVYWLARTYETKGQLQKSVELYDSLLKAFPRHPILPRVHLSLGNAYYALEQWDAASKQYQFLVEGEEQPADLVQFAMSNLIMAYKEIGLFDAALQLDRRYIENYPDDPDLITKRIDIGVLYQRLGYYDQSILHLQGMLENAAPDLEAELRYYIGEAYFYKGSYQQAILEFLKVPYLVTKQTKVDWIATSYYMAGQSYEKLSKFDEATTMYRQIVERPGIDVTFKTAAQKEIDRVRALIRKP